MDGTFGAFATAEDWDILSGTRQLHGVSREGDDDCA